MKQSQRKFLFTITPGHTGTTWLAELCKLNLPNASVYHEILGYDRFGVDTPDVSHMTLFNSVGNVAHVRSFWQRKAERVLAHSSEWYVETSHLLSKCGLMENIGHFSRHGTVYILCLDRELSPLVASMRRRGDMINKGDQWLWHLDPDYPRKLVAPDYFAPFGVDGWRLWYACEMRCRAAYYRRLMEKNDGIVFIRSGIETLTSASGMQAFFHEIGAPLDNEALSVPPRQNVGGVHGQEEKRQFPIDETIREMTFDADAIAARHIARGYDIGAALEDG